MKNTISIHNDTIFNKEHDFRKGNGSYSYIDTEKSKDNIYVEGNLITKEDKNKVYQMVISFNGDYNEETLKNSLVEYINTFEKRNAPVLKVNYGAIHCDEKNMLPHMHLTYSIADDFSVDFFQDEKEYLHTLYREKRFQAIKEYLNTRN